MAILNGQARLLATTLGVVKSFGGKTMTCSRKSFATLNVNFYLKLKNKCKTEIPHVRAI